MLGSIPDGTNKSSLSYRKQTTAVTTAARFTVFFFAFEFSIKEYPILFPPTTYRYLYIIHSSDRCPVGGGCRRILRYSDGKFVEFDAPDLHDVCSYL